MPTLGEQVRAAREARSWTQVDLANVIGMSQSVVSNLERGLRPSVTVLLLIAKVFPALADECEALLPVTK
jgi:transcriptional regulator with XRE-family HTH domain